MKRSGLFIIFLTILFLCHSYAIGETVNIYAAGDATVNSYYPSTTNFNRYDLYSGDQQRGDNRAFIYFNLVNAPKDVASVKLILSNKYVSSSQEPFNVSVYRVIDSWSEGTISWIRQPGFEPDAVTSASTSFSQTETVFDLTDLYRDWTVGLVANFGIVLNTDGSEAQMAYCGTYGCYAGVFYSKDYMASRGPRLEIEVASANNPPAADAGENLTVDSADLEISFIKGSATDADPGDVLEYQWSLGGTALMEWTGVPETGEAELDLSVCAYLLSVGTHTLTLTVRDGKAESSDTMQLTVDNSAPTVAALGGGVYNYGDPVEVSGTVSDYDGDTLFYQWYEGDNLFCSGTQATVQGGDPVNLPACTLSGLDLGVHELTLSVSEANFLSMAAVTNVSSAAVANVRVEITDLTKPTLTPVANRQILWPPNHRWKRVVIYTHASDNLGGPVTLSASVSSNEADSGLWRGDRGPDWTDPWIRDGRIYVWLRAERSPRGEGREYTIDITAEDESGNLSEAQVKVMVPHDRGKQAQHRIAKLKKRLQEIWSHRRHHRWHR